MSLRRAVMLAIIGSCLLIVILLLHLIRSRNASRFFDQTSQASYSITTAIAELDQLVYQYMLHPHPRPVQQWRLLSDKLGTMLKTLDAPGESLLLINQLRSEHLQARQIFDAIVMTPANENSTAFTMSMQRSRLTEQMLLVSRSLINHSTLIHRESLREQARIESRDNTITLFALGATIALMSWLLIYVRRNVLSRLELLRTSAERAADGQLELNLCDPRPDEIGQLTRAFDHLLREVRIGRDQLSKDASLRASEERQRQLIDAMPSLVWAAQPDGTIDTSNLSWREQFTITPDAPGYDWTELIHPNDLTSWRIAWSAALSNGTSFEIEFRLRRKNGWRWYLTRVASLADEQGKILRWVCKAVDIHHHKELEQHLRSSRNQAELLNQVGLDLVGELDVQRLTKRVTDTARALVDAEFSALFFNVNDAAEQDGYRLYAVSGLSLEDFNGVDLPSTSELFRPSLLIKGVIRCDDVRLDSRFGDQAHRQGLPADLPPVVSYLALPVQTRYGKILGGMFCTHSQPGKFTAQHERLLLGIVALAATAFDSAHLIESERRQRRLADQRSFDLARSNAELEQFAYICSHDLQEPLRMVNTFLGLLEERNRAQLDERGLSFIRRAVDGSTRMQNLIRDILAYSRVGRGEHAEEIFNLSEIVQAAMVNLQASMEENAAQIQIGELPKIRGNRLQCVQLMQNLIGNALKFHGEEPPLIRISAVAEGPRWRISVSDNGIGIDPAHHQRIFQVFQRLHGRERFEGTGIGLSLCQKIVLAHGGTIGVDSQPGQGACFWFTLPDVATASEMTPDSGVHRVINV